MKNSSGVTPNEYFNYFCTDVQAVTHYFSNQSGVDALEEEIGFLERRAERQEEVLIKYERFVEDLLAVAERDFPKTKQKVISQLLETHNIEY
jgi:hypothetical protein